MIMGGTEGYILIGIGDKYLQMTKNLTETLKKHGDNRGTLTITRSDNRELYSECNTEFERNGTLPKITLDRYLPFDHNIFLDADMLCVGDTQHVWDLFRSSDQFVQQVGCLGRDPNFHAHQYESELGFEIPRVHGGCIYINREKLDPGFFPYMRESFLNYKQIFHNSGLTYKNSRPDQPLYALANGMWGFKPVDLYTNPIMTIVNDSTPPPLDSVFFNKKRGPKLDTPVPFVHVFRGEEGMSKGYTRGDQKMLLSHYDYYLNYE